MVGWCADEWCYVAPWQCTGKQYLTSDYFDGARIGNATLLSTLDDPASGDCASDLLQVQRKLQLAFSYTTCGSLDAFSTTAGQISLWSVLVA